MKLFRKHTMTQITIIAAISENYVIGNKGKIPWHIPEDLKRFKQLTTGNTVIMGRKTYETIGKPLPNRKNIVVTKNKEFSADGIFVAHTLEEALAQCTEKTYIIGGQQIYEQAMPLADKLEITHVHKIVEGDAFFPQITNNWKEIKKIDKKEYSFVTYTCSN